MSLPIVTYESGLMIVTHPTGIVAKFTKTELQELRDFQIDEMSRTGKQIEDTNLQIVELDLSLTR